MIFIKHKITVEKERESFQIKYTIINNKAKLFTPQFLGNSLVLSFVSVALKWCVDGFCWQFHSS